MSALEIANPRRVHRCGGGEELEGGGTAVQGLAALGVMVLAALGWFTAAFLSCRLVLARARTGRSFLD